MSKPADPPLVPQRSASEMLGGAAADPSTVAALIDNQVVDLTTLIVDKPSVLEAVSRMSPEGARVYKRSVALLLGMAVRRCGLGPLVIEGALGASLLCSLPDAASPETAAALTDTMRAMIGEAIPIGRELVPRAEALAHFAERGAERTVEFVRARNETRVDCYSVELGEGKGGRHLVLAHNGPMVPSTAMLDPSHLALEIVPGSARHYRLHHAVPSASGSFELASAPEPVLLGAYEARAAWNAHAGVRTVSQVNAAISGSRTKSLVQLAEAEHDMQVVQLAARIAGASVPPAERPRLVLIAGPTSSGKTTFAKRLCVALETLGARPQVISVDSYYRAWSEIDERGAKHVDWEALGSLDLPLLNEHLNALLGGREVSVPEYDMKTSTPADKSLWTPTKLRPGGLIIMEGIHCLNPELTSRVPRAEKFGICISPLSALALDDSRLLSSSHVRMLRRIVRDHLNRGRSAISTLRQWASVARGERANIFPNQNHADAAFNSALCYEANVLKAYAEPLLRAIEPREPEYGEARRLLLALDQLVAMPPTLVPPQSLLREFIGGSWYYDYAGWYQSA